jgi:UDP-N-acetylmuramate dehydrogenase
MEIRENVPLRPMTTMRIGGEARWFAHLMTEQDVSDAWAFVKEKRLPLIVLGSGSNTIFADGTIEAMVVRLKHETVTVDGQTVTASAGKNLPMLINELAAQGLNLSALTGIPGTVGGAVFGNAGQGPKGVWIDSFVVSVRAFVDGEWRTMSRDDCDFRYRESAFKDMAEPAIVWNVTLSIPTGEPAAIKANIEALLKKRIETQPHQRTAGSCFKAVSGTPAWQLIDAAGLRGASVGGISVSEKHANFLLSKPEGSTYADAKALVQKVKAAIPEQLEVEMRFVEEDGGLAF